MDPDAPPPPPCSCGCPCCGSAAPSLKRKLGQMPDLARVEAENELAALREALISQQLSVQHLYTELDEERSSSATAASEAMSMILRLQREKADAQMESRQFHRFAEEKIEHLQREIAELEDLVFRREEAVQSLSFQLQAYRHRLASYTGTLSEPHSPEFDYPPLRCNTFAPPDFSDDVWETPCEQFHELEQRVQQLEWIPSGSHAAEKGVIGQDELQATTSDHGWKDEASDRIYSVDAVHGVPYVSTPRDVNGNIKGKDVEVEEAEIKRLYARVQALEADRESMRQTMLSLGSDKAQVVLLREIAQHLCKEGPPEKKVAKKPSFIRSFSIITVIKWAASFVFWRRKSTPIKYTFGLTRGNVGLLLLLEKSSHMRQRRYLTRPQG